MIDLSAMRSVTVSEAATHVTVEGGCLLHDLDRVLSPLGKCVPSGLVSETVHTNNQSMQSPRADLFEGIGGLTLGGGIGWLSRSFGLTCDQLLIATVVLADGTVVIASNSENSDLFWALKVHYVPNYHREE